MHMEYTPRKFDLPELKGLSKKQVDVHLALYEGYVKNINLLLKTIGMYEGTDDDGGRAAVTEMRRRLAFEFDGMRMHELYFSQFEGTGGSEESPLGKLVTAQYGSGEKFMAHIRRVAGTRGIGWVVVYYDATVKGLHTVFVADHEVGQLAGLPIILALDLWEHAYMVDYVPAQKMDYVDAFFSNLNGAVLEKRFDDAVKASAA